MRHISCIDIESRINRVTIFSAVNPPLSCMVVEGATAPGVGVDLGMVDWAKRLNSRVYSYSSHYHALVLKYRVSRKKGRR